MKGLRGKRKKIYLDIKIRSFREEDFEAVIKILVYCFKNKFHYDKPCK